MLGGVDNGDAGGGASGGVSWEGWAERLVNADGVRGMLAVVRTMEGLIADNDDTIGRSGSGNDNGGSKRRMVVPPPRPISRLSFPAHPTRHGGTIS